MSGSHKDTEKTYRSFPLRLGRSDACHVRFDAQQDLKVSALHAEVRRADGGGFEVWDLDSKNGVFLNGQQVEGWSRLPPRAQIEVGAGGPKLDVMVVEGGSGISFADIRKETTTFEAAVGESRPLLATEDAMQAYDGPKLAPSTAGEGWPLQYRILILLLACVAVSVVYMFVS